MMNDILLLQVLFYELIRNIDEMLRVLIMKKLKIV